MVFRSIFRSIAACVVGLGLMAGPCAAQTTTTYAYDGAGRLVSAVDSTGPQVVYTYDKAGNRTSVGNGVDPGELLPTGYSESSVMAGTSAPAGAALRDGAFDTRGSIAATGSQNDAWIQMNLGSVVNVARVKLAPANDAGLALGPATTNGSVLEYSADGATWTMVSPVTTAVQGIYRTYGLNGALAQFIRVRRAGPGQLALGDLRAYSTADGSGNAFGIPTYQANASTGAPTTLTPLSGITGFTITGIATQPPNGSATTSDGQSIVYTSNPGVSGTDTFTYNVSDANGVAGVATVIVLVNPATGGGGLTLIPFAMPDFVSGFISTTVTFNPTANDLDPYNGAIQLVSVSPDPYGDSLRRKDLSTSRGSGPTPP